MGNKWWGSDIPTPDLRKILDRRVREIERSMNAIGGQNDFALKKLPAYQLFKELSKGQEGNRKMDLSSGSRLETVQALNKIDTLQNMKSSTLKGSKAIIAKRKRHFVEKNVEAIALNYLRDNPELTEEKARNKATYFLRRLTNSEEFYDFLHSTEYEKITGKYGLESGDIIRDFMTRTVSLLDNYMELEETQMGVEQNYTNYLTYIEQTKGATFEFKQVISEDTILDEELEEIKKDKNWK